MFVSFFRVRSEIDIISKSFATSDLLLVILVSTRSFAWDPIYCVYQSDVLQNVT